MCDVVMQLVLTMRNFKLSSPCVTLKFMYVWFKFILCFLFFELISILFAIVPDYGNEYMRKESKN